MSVLEQLASAQGVSNAVPNQELGRVLAADEDTEAIRELVANLNTNKAIQSDCIKVLYEIGYLKPALIAAYVSEFLALLTSRNNRLVWGGMIALSTIAGLRTQEIYAQREQITAAMEQGSVITRDAGIRTLAGVAAADPAYHAALFPYLLEQLRTCRSQSVAQYAESIFPAVGAADRPSYSDVLRERLETLTPSPHKRVERLLKRLA